ncbi:MAG TPA: ATP synthase F1 subunit delta [Vicinamibacterales bacterium]|nr:ATP synthase F1 subunit delta [Vicinamibacterales bacterium]
MTSRTAAARYARALLDVATKESADLDTIGRELDEFTAFLSQQAALERLLLNPAVPAPRKRAAMEEIIKVAGLSPIVSKLLILLADRDRLTLLKDVAATYRDVLAERQNVLHAEVTSAEPLTDERVKAIEERLATLTGKRVSMTTKVDKDIIGGVVARVGSTIYDASIATQLKKIRERLTT